MIFFLHNNSENHGKPKLVIIIKQTLIVVNTLVFIYIFIIKNLKFLFSINLRIYHKSEK